MKKVFITGGSSGIGAGLALALAKSGKQVLVGGRNLETLRLVADRHANIEPVVVDVSDLGSIRRAYESLSARHPDLDSIVNNAGIQNLFDLTDAIDLEAMQQEIATNFTGLISLTSIFMPLLRRQPQATIINVSSGLALVPLTRAPVYSATKAAVHSFSISLREQLRGTNVRVREILPPAVETNLHARHGRKPKKVMPLEEFILETMAELETAKDELPIGIAKVLRFGSRLAPKRFLTIINS